MQQKRFNLISNNNVYDTGMDVFILLDRSGSTEPFLKDIIVAIKALIVKLQAIVKGEDGTISFNDFGALEKCKIHLNIITFHNYHQYYIKDKNILDIDVNSINPDAKELKAEGATDIGSPLKTAIDDAIANYKRRCEDDKVPMYHPIIFLFTDGKLESGVDAEKSPKEFMQTEEKIIKELREAKVKLNKQEQDDNKQQHLSFICCAYDEGINEDMENLSIYGDDRLIRCEKSEKGVQKLLNFFSNNIANLLVSQTQTPEDLTKTAKNIL